MSQQQVSWLLFNYYSFNPLILYVCSLRIQLTFTNCFILLQSLSFKVYQLLCFCLTAWVGGFIAISIISFLSLLGVILVPLMNRVFFKFLLSFLVALAVGTLSGDAFLHLLPHVSMVICPISMFYYSI